ncbi:MAG: hypothetical protein ACYDA9_08140 [Terriglobia bacterium]
MKQFRWLSCGFLIAALGPGPLLRADTIYQTSPQGKQVVIQRDAIVVKEDSNYLYYKHFDLKDRRVEKVSLNKGSLPFQVRKTPAADRQQIVDVWKRFGYHLTVTDQAGKTTRVYDAFLDFYPPAGRGSLLESVPARTSFPILIQGGSADEVEFSNIARIEFQGQQMRLTLRSGEVEVGTFLMPTQHPAEARLLGITDHYDPASADVFDFSGTLAGLKEIRFDNQ